MTPQRICLFTHFNTYETKRHFTFALADALEGLGVQTYVLDVGEQVLGTEQLRQIKAFNPQITLSYNTLLPMSDGRQFADFLGIRHFYLNLDPVLYSLELTKSPLTYITCIDRLDLKSLQEMGYERAFFWPHAAEMSFVSPKLPRPYEAVFFGSCYDYETLRAQWRADETPFVQKVLDRAIELSLASDTIPIYDALVNAWNEEVNGEPPENVDFLALFYYLDYYVRGVDRVELIRSIKSVPIHVFGAISPDLPRSVLGWEHYLRHQSNVVFHPPLPFNDALEVMGQSRLCLNSIPPYRYGSHERVFDGLVKGASVLTSYSDYWQEAFSNEARPAIYSCQRRDAIEETVTHLLSNENERQKKVALAQKEISEQHTWPHRAKALLKIMSEI